MLSLSSRFSVPHLIWLSLLGHIPYCRVDAGQSRTVDRRERHFCRRTIRGSPAADDNGVPGKYGAARDDCDDANQRECGLLYPDRHYSEPAQRRGDTLDTAIKCSMHSSYLCRLKQLLKLAVEAADAT